MCFFIPVSDMSNGSASSLIVALLDAYARDSAAWTLGGRRRRTRKPRSVRAVAGSLGR
jgi:hypothetical protein